MTDQALTNSTESVEVKWIETFTVETAKEQATQLFIEQYGYQPDSFYAAPGRVNLIGEHIDYAGGMVLPLALPNCAYAVAAKREDEILRFTSLGASPSMVECKLSEVAPGNPNNWAGYLAGAVWAAVEAGLIPAQGMDLAMVCDVPFGAGLSSSAAIECVALMAACGLAGLELTPQLRSELVKCAMRAENEVVGAATGGMDQQISLQGAEKNLMAIDFLNNTIQPIPFDLESVNLVLLVCNTNASHSLSDGQYESRRRVIDGVAESLGVNPILGLTPDQDWQKHADQWAEDNPSAEHSAEEWRDVVRRRVGHIFAEAARTHDAVAALRSNDFARLGELMWQSHASLRDDYEVSVPELDLVVECARELGAVGARMTGGGFGGSAIALISKDKVEELAELITKEAVAKGHPIPEFQVAVAGAGARYLGRI